MPEFNAKEVAVIIDGETVALLDSVGYDDSNDDELERSLDEDGYVWITGDQEITGAVSVKAVSSSVEPLMELYQNHTTFTMSVSYPSAMPIDSSDFIDTRLQDFGPSGDFENSDMPMYEGSFECGRIRHDFG